MSPDEARATAEAERAVDLTKLARMHVALGRLVEFGYEVLPRLKAKGIDYTLMPKALHEIGTEFGPFWDLPEDSPDVVESAARAVGIDPNEDEIEVSVLELRVRRAQERGDLLGDAYERHRDRADAAEALVSTLGSALEDLAFWFRRLAEDEHWSMEDGVMALEAETETAAALASYQEWDPANPSTGEGTE